MAVHCVAVGQPISGEGGSMNKYLMLSAAALFASATGVSAATYTFKFDSMACDSGIMRTHAGSPQAATWTHNSNNCAGGTSEGAGLLTKVKGLGKVYPMSDTFFAKNYGIFSEQISWTLPAKPVNGAPWTLWIGINGVSSFEGNSGILSDVTKGKAHILHGSTKSIVSAMRQMLAARGRIIR
jgi:hypothetical protein